MTEFIGTTGNDNFVGGTGDDVFIFDPSKYQLADKISGGGGINALGLINDRNKTWEISSTKWLGMSKIHGIVLLSLDPDGGNTAGFKLTFTDSFYKANKVSNFVIDASAIASAGLQLSASNVTNMSFDIYGSDGSYEGEFRGTGPLDNLRTGARDDRFIYYHSTLISDQIDGGKGNDTIVLVGAGNKSFSETDPDGFTTLSNIRNIENVVITDLLAGQSRTIKFSDAISIGQLNITTDRNYDTGKAASAIDGKLIVDGASLTSTKEKLFVTGGNAADELTGGAGGDHFSGGKGNDVLIGRAGDDWISGGLGDDIIAGDYAAYDYLSFDEPHGNDIMYGGDGNDTFVLHQRQMVAKPQRDLISGGTGVDTIFFASKGVPVTTLMLDSLNVSGIEIIDMDGAGNTFTFSQHFLENNHDQNGRIVLRNGTEAFGPVVFDASQLTNPKYSVHFIIRGWNKGDTLTGGMGDDLFDYTSGVKRYALSGVDVRDIFSGGGGTDTILISEGKSAVLGKTITSMEKLKVVAQSNSGSTTDIVIGTLEAMSIDGSMLAANDSLVAQGYFKDPNTGKISEAQASVSIIGGKGDDILTGGRAGDKLYGGDGDDVLTGYKGLDRLTGGKGADHFVFRNADESTVAAIGRDVITDFHRSEGDKIQFLHETAKPYSFIGNDMFHGKAGEVRSIISGSNTYVQLDADGDGKADLGIALTGKITLTSADFLL